jgi:hypothetical protein
MRVSDGESLLRAYDEQMRGIGTGRPGLVIERDGPVLRVAGEHRGFVTAPRDLGVDGPELDALIARQRDYFAARGDAVEWKTRGHDRPAGLTGRLRAAGFFPEDQETVVIGVAADADLRAIAAMEGTVWGQDLSHMGEDLIARRAHAPGAITFFSVTGDTTGEVVSAAWIIYHPGTDFAYLAAAPRWRPGASAASTAPSSQCWPGRRPRAARATSWWTPPTTAPRSSAASASEQLPLPLRTSGRRRPLPTSRGGLHGNAGRAAGPAPGQSVNPH